MKKQKPIAHGNAKTPTHKLGAEVCISGFNVFAIYGEIVDESETGITIRYQKDKSRSVQREHFANSSIVAIQKYFDTCTSIVWVKSNRSLLNVHCGKPTKLENGMVKLVTTAGDELIVNPANSAGFETSIRYLEEDEFSGKPKSKEGKRQSETEAYPDAEDDDEDEKPKKLKKKKKKKVKLKA